MSKTKTSEEWLLELGITPTESPEVTAAKASPGVLTSPLTLATFKRDEVIERARVDLDFLASLVLGEVASCLYPPIFHAAWQLLTTSTPQEALKKFPKLCLGLPRGIGKTTFMKLFVCWCILFTELKFILVVCAIASLAENFIADVFDMLDTENVRRLFGDWRIGIEKDTQEIKKFGFRGRNIIVAARGAESSLRGMNLKNERPDLIIMDDIQKKEDAESVARSTDLLSWIVGTLMKTKPYTGCLYIYIGNMYPGTGCILRKLKHNPTWVSFICGAILADGQSIWPELVSVEQLLEELANDTALGHPEIFYSEVLNDDEAGSRSGIDISKIPTCPEHIANLEVPHQGSVIIIDPASGKVTGNDVAIGLFLLYDGIPFLARLEAGKFSPGETIEKALVLALTFGCRTIVVESVAYQYTLLYWFNFLSEMKGIDGIDLCELPVQEFSKNAGIGQALLALVRGEIMLYPEVRAAVVYQIIHWNKLKRDNEDDILDLLRMISSVIAVFGHQMVSDAPLTVAHEDEYRTLSLEEMLTSQQGQYIDFEKRYH